MIHSRRASDDGRARRFDCLYVEHYAVVYAFVHRRLGGSNVDVADVVAEVFSTAWRRLDSVPEGPDARLWLYGTARNAVRNQRRGWRRRLRLADRLAEEARADGERDHELCADDRSLVEAIARLPAPDREVLRLVGWEGTTHAEAAQILGCSVNAIALRVRKAKQRLREDPAVAAYLNRPPTEPARALNSRRD